MDLTDKQWAVLEPLLGKPVVREDGRGRPWRDPRDVLNGILWVMRTGAPWDDLPPRYPTRQTKAGRRVHRRDLRTGKKGGDRIGPTKRGKGTKVMAIVDGNGLPLATTTIFLRSS